MPHTILIIVEHTSDPIRGRVAVSGEDDRSFAGWLELLSALDRGLRRPEAASAPEGGIGGDVLTIALDAATGAKRRRATHGGEADRHDGGSAVADR
jgi:hypothetical protein